MFILFTSLERVADSFSCVCFTSSGPASVFQIKKKKLAETLIFLYLENDYTTTTTTIVIVIVIVIVYQALLTHSVFII